MSERVRVEMKDGVIILNADLSIVTVNDAFTAICGYTDEELAGEIESNGPGKNVLIRNKFVREDTGTHETLKILDDSLVDSGEETGIELNGEEGGILARPDNWSGRTKPTIAIGQDKHRLYDTDEYHQDRRDGDNRKRKRVQAARARASVNVST